jgi:hypothetical protein
VSISLSESHPLQQLCDSRINFSITTARDGGFDVKLGDFTFGFSAETNVATFQEAVGWLLAQAAAQFPNFDDPADEDALPTR